MTMTYYGTTAATTAANPPVRLTGGIGMISYPGDLTTSARGTQVWFYSSTNVPADMSAAGTFVDGVRLGMKNGDILMGVMNGGATSTDAYTYVGALVCTETSLTTGAFHLSSNYTT